MVKTFASVTSAPAALAAIPEHNPRPRPPSRPSSGMSTPKATKISLRSGSVVTVTQPETVSAWRINVYIQGPIKLPKPVILPKKNSVASMDAFQEAIDQVYQSALFMPRRRSDDAFSYDVRVSFSLSWSFFFGPSLPTEQRSSLRHRTSR